MRLATIRTPSGTRAVRVEGAEYVDLGFDDVGHLLHSPTWPELASRTEGERFVVDDVELAPVVTAPEKVICVGLNYASHILEMGRELPSHPTLFAKFASTLTGPRDELAVPREAGAALDWEAELAIVIGAPVRGADDAAAADAIAGYTVLNDISMRDWQNRTTEWLQGKSWEATTPIGPVLVTPDELPADGMQISCSVDGEVVQDSHTSDLLFTPVELVKYISTITTLRPGDVIATGTPGGVGHGREPRVYLKDGQVVRTVIEGIGELENRVAIGS